MCFVDARVKHSNLERVKSFAETPRTRGIYVDGGIGIKCPLLGIARVIGDIGHVNPIIGLSRNHSVGCSQSTQRIPDGCSDGDLRESRKNTKFANQSTVKIGQ